MVLQHRCLESFGGVYTYPNEVGQLHGNLIGMAAVPRAEILATPSTGGVW